jgi:signal transduction histidine kinase
VLELPARLAKEQLLAAGALLAAMAAWLAADGTPPAVAFGLALSTGALLALPPVPLYWAARAALGREALPLDDGVPHAGHPLSLALQIGYPVAAVALAALLPSAVLGAAALDVGSVALAKQRALAAGRRLAVAAEPLGVGAATALVTRTPLEQGARTLLRTAAGTLLPEEAVAELADLPFVEVPLAGALRGATLQVAYREAGSVGGALLLVTLLGFALALPLAAALGGAVAADARNVAAQIERVARDDEPGAIGGVATLEVRRLTLAINRLLERIPRLTVESFLAIERAGEASRLKSQFLANMSHDLRSPLNSILGFSELLLRGLEGPVSERQRAALEAMHSTGQRLLRMLNEILDTAKVESGKMELHRQSVAPVELLRQATQDAQRGRPPSEIDQLFVVMQPGIEPIHVDPLRIQQALTHLLNHALDTAPGQKVVLRASRGEHQGGRAFVVDLEYGGALDAEERASLFDGFRRVRGHRGLHLALPLAHRLVTLHAGTLALAGGDGPGVHLRAVIPVSRRAA